jgi:hypothetical protein
VYIKGRGLVMAWTPCKESNHLSEEDVDNSYYLRGQGSNPSPATRQGKVDINCKLFSLLLVTLAFLGRSR